MRPHRTCDQPVLSVFKSMSRDSLMNPPNSWVVHDRRIARTNVDVYDEACAAVKAVRLGDQAGSHQFRLPLACIGAIQPVGTAISTKCAGASMILIDTSAWAEYLRNT